MNNNTDPLKKLKDYFSKPSEPNTNIEITELENMEQETEITGKMTGYEPYFYD